MWVFSPILFPTSVCCFFSCCGLYHLFPQLLCICWAILKEVIISVLLIQLLCLIFVSSMAISFTMIFFYFLYSKHENKIVTCLYSSSAGSFSLITHLWMRWIFSAVPLCKRFMLGKSCHDVLGWPPEIFLVHNKISYNTLHM